MFLLGELEQYIKKIHIREVQNQVLTKIKALPLPFVSFDQFFWPERVTENTKNQIRIPIGDLFLFGVFIFILWKVFII